LKRQLGQQHELRAIFLGLGTAILLSISSQSARAQTCELADILFNRVQLEIVEHDDYETATVRTIEGNSANDELGKIVGEIYADRGAYVLQNTKDETVGLINPDFVVDPFQDCDRSETLEIVPVRDGSYIVLSGKTPVGTIAGRFPEADFSTEEGTVTLT